MSKVTFGAGVISTAADVVVVADKHGLFRDFWWSLFTVIFGIAISVLGGLWFISIKDWVKRLTNDRK